MRNRFKLFRDLANKIRDADDPAVSFQAWLKQAGNPVRLAIWILAISVVAIVWATL